MCSMASSASVMHADLDAFYASVEQRDDPRLAGRPMAVGGGVILSASYEARAQGVRTAMSIRAARALCPTLVTVEPRMHDYARASREVFAIFDDTTPLVEPISIDEAFLDVGGLRRLVGSPVAIATSLRARVAAEVGLPISIGVARTKFLAKVASGVCKPDGLLVVEPDRELAFLHPLPVRRLWGVGPVTAEKLEQRGITTVGEVARLDPGALEAMLGRGPGHHIHALAHNRDPRQVVTGRRRSSIGSQRALGTRRRSLADLEVVLVELIDRVTHRLRAGERVGRTVTVRFRFGDYRRDTRSRSLPAATANTAELHAVARELLRARADELHERGVTMLGVTVSNLSPANAVQQALPFDARSRRDLDVALDDVRRRFGTGSIGRAAVLGQSVDPLVPLLPDPS